VYPSRATNVPIEVTHAGGTNTVYVNQQLNGGQWNLLGTWSFGSSAAVTIRAVGNSTSTNADAVMLVPAVAPPPPPGSCYTVSRPSVLYSALSPPSGTTGPYIFSIPPDQDGVKGTASIVDASTGEFQFVPNSNDWGMDSFVYNVDASDGPHALSATVVIAPRIMPLGDSITAGVVIGDTLTPPVEDRVGYRSALKTSLANAGYPTDFVGSLDMGYALFSDSQHEGRGGWKDEEIAWGRVGVSNSGIYNWLVLNPADIILLHIGTNSLDPNGQADVAAILNELDRWERSAGGNPVRLFLARIIDENPINPDVTTYNNNVEAMALDRVNNPANPAYPDQIVIVDQHSALAYPTDLADQVHPNATGYGKMGARWAEVLQPLLPTCP
jgi:hypothetical protein